MRVGDGIGVFATATKLANLVHWSKTSGVVRLDGIGLMFASESDSSQWSSKPTLNSEPVKSLRRNVPDSGRNNRCQANDQSGIMIDK